MNTEQQTDPNQEAFQRFEAMRRDWMATQEERDKWRRYAEEREVRIHELERERAGCDPEARIKELEWKCAQLQDALDRGVKRIAELKRSCDKAGLEMRRMQNEIDRYELQLSGKQSDAPDREKFSEYCSTALEGHCRNFSGWAPIPPRRSLRRWILETFWE